MGVGSGESPIFSYLALKLLSILFNVTVMPHARIDPSSQESSSRFLLLAVLICWSILMYYCLSPENPSKSPASSIVLLCRSSFSSSTSWRTCEEIKKFISASFLRFCKCSVKRMAEWKELVLQKAAARRLSGKLGGGAVRLEMLTSKWQAEIKRVNKQFSTWLKQDSTKLLY